MVVKLLETESRMVVSRDYWENKMGVAIQRALRVSVMQGENNIVPTVKNIV